MQYTNGSHAGSPPAMATTPAPADPKTVRFQLITPDSPHTTARLPMRVQIYPHDATDSIITTVKNFYGLYSSPTSSKGVSFEDEAGITMIARYENFRDNMVVYVRVIEEPALSPSAFASRNYRSPPTVGSGTALTYSNGDSHNTSSSAGAPGSAPYYSGHQASLHHLQQQGEYISRPGSRTSRKRSLSPSSARGRRSDSASTNSKNRSRSSKNRGGPAIDPYATENNGYSSGDGAPDSNSGRVKEQQPIGNTEISVENIVEGGRRKRAKFESSELPLFAPPQMPAATSNPSVSPARRADHRPSLPFVHPSQNPFNGASALQSPQNYNTHFQMGVYATPVSDGRRTRASIGYSGAGMSMGILPTPDPTVSSVSEEDKDVAMQLMRLGEISNMPYGGRTSTSTQDDTFSGRADAASSTGATSDGESDSGADYGDDDEEDEEDLAPPKRKQRLDTNGTSRKIYQSVENSDDDTADTDYKEEAPASGLMAAPKLKKVTKTTIGNANDNTATNGSNGTKQVRAQPAAKAKTTKSKAKTSSGANGSKSKKVTANSGTNGLVTATASIVPGVPMSPASMPTSRKLSVASSNGSIPAPIVGAVAGGATGDEEITDLSSKPRCQRCRKSKKGCDRQRPCGRCRDAGIPAELCISEDEGNGRKGRYGRHMGVPIKKDTAASSNGAATMQPPPPPAVAPAQTQAQALAHAHSHNGHGHNHTHAHTHAAQAQAGMQQFQLLPPPSPSHQKHTPSLLPPPTISSTPIIAPVVPGMAMVSTDKSKKRKR